ncbi:hypothetical protein GCM10027036_23250 [Flavihumibacter cheonanensis]|uniref:restriction endonuclease subunit S n=1 Tax=Flavihumibacter cheonanensis TaxID=1442385 RepID=UPI001EF970FF|nr:restriction endonuclease subunit S [Flavihumibacter cheonanensis]MCG7754456.1 restriction endonuclease subunit S [Flavihumibacter cheonanensis]
MKISYADYIKKSDVSVLVAEAIFHDLNEKYPNKKIEEVADTTSGGTPLRGNHDYYGGNIPWVKSGELNDGFIDQAEEYITDKGLANSSAKLHPEGTLLIAMYGATAGKTAITRIKTATNQAICAVFPKPCVERDYLFWFFKAHRYKFIEMSKGGAQPNISQTVILKTPLPIPEINIQKKIISILERVRKSNDLDLSFIPEEYRPTVCKVFSSKNNITSLEAELNNQYSLLIQLRQAFLREAMQGKLVMQDPKDGHARDLLEKIKDEKAKSGKKEKELPPIKPEEIPFGIPENWVWCRLGEISYIQTGIALGKKFAGKLHKYPYLRVANVQRGSVDLSTVKYLELPIEIAKKYYLKQFDILVNEGGDFDKVGRCAIWGASIQPCIHQNHIFAVRIDGVNQQYFEYAINSDSSRDYFLGTYKKSTNLASLNKTNLNLLPVPLPPLNEQNRIVEKLSELMNLCDDLQQSIQTSRDQNEYLLQQVLKEALMVNK